MSFTKFNAKKMMTSLVPIGALIAVVGSANPGLEVTGVKLESNRSVNLQYDPQVNLQNVSLDQFFKAKYEKVKEDLPSGKEMFQNWKDAMTDKEKLVANGTEAAKMYANGAYYLTGANHVVNAGDMTLKGVKFVGKKAHEEVLLPLGKMASKTDGKPAGVGLTAYAAGSTMICFGLAGWWLVLAVALITLGTALVAAACVAGNMRNSN